MPNPEGPDKTNKPCLLLSGSAISGVDNRISIHKRNCNASKRYIQQRPRTSDPTKTELIAKTPSTEQTQ
jgi:hypothetical protein